MDILELIQNFQVPVVVLTCLCVGYVIKHGIKSATLDNFIPLIMAVIGVGMNIWVNMAFTPAILVGGLVSGLASTGLHQAFTKAISVIKSKDVPVDEEKAE